MKKILLAIPVAALLAGGWWWWSGSETNDPSEVVLHGNVDIRHVALAFDGSGRIESLDAEEGDPVKAGQVIGKLDTKSLELNVRKAQALVEAARQTLQRLRNGERPEAIAQVRAQLVSAQATAARAEQDLTRANRLQSSSSGAVSGQAVDHAESEAAAANARVEELRAALALSEAGTRAEEIAAAEANLAAEEANLALLVHEVDQGTLRAPVDAIVRSRLLEPGDQATPQRPVFSLAKTDPKWVRVYVNEPDLGKLRPGMAAQVFTDSYPDRPVAGTVGYISSVAEFTPKSVQTEDLRTSLVYEVRIVVEDATDALRLGQPVTVRIAVGQAS